MEEIASLHPQTAHVLAAYGLHCVGCAYSTMETLEEGAQAHGLTDDDVSALMIDLEEALDAPVTTVQELIVTDAAAHALEMIANQEKKVGCILRVAMNPDGAFCMEFEDPPTKEGDVCIKHPAAPSVVVAIAPTILTKIGGAVIDYRENRFKLDLPKASCPCSTSPHP